MLVGTAYKRDDLGRKIIGSDGFPLVNDQQIIIGDPNPDWLMGIHNNFTFKNLETEFSLGYSSWRRYLEWDPWCYELPWAFQKKVVI